MGRRVRVAGTAEPLGVLTYRYIGMHVYCTTEQLQHCAATPATSHTQSTQGSGCSRLKCQGNAIHAVAQAGGLGAVIKHCRAGKPMCTQSGAWTRHRWRCLQACIV